MNNFTGTKGKWKTIIGGFSTKTKNPNIIQVYSANEDLEMICKVYKDNLLHNKKQDFEANARLIATAPELLEIAQITLNWIKTGQEMETDIKNRCEKAICKVFPQ